MTLSLRVAFAALALPFLTAAAHAGPIETACLQSNRDGANRSTCSCIQQVADMTLRGPDQKRAARFFANPDEAQEVFVSQRARDDAFWERYRSFGDAAEAYCAG